MIMNRHPWIWRKGRCGRVGWLAALAIFAAGCSLEPDYIRPQTQIPEAWRNTPPAEPLPQPPSQWWMAYGSADLDRLVEDALANNHDLKAAVRRILQAEALAGVAAGPLLPSVGLSAKDELSAPKAGVGDAASGKEARDRTKLYSVGVTASYEVDWWGKNRSAMNAALSTAQASVYDREVVAQTLASDVTSAYFQFLSACERTIVAQSNIDNMKRVLTTVERRVAVGEGTALELRQQKAILAQAEATMPIIEQLRENTFNKIAVLTGRPPKALKLDCAPIDGVGLPTINAGLPSELLLRRPDIRKAEAGLDAATAKIGEARAKMFPTFALTGERGFGSHYLTSLLSPQSFYLTLAANFAVSLFDNGRIRSEIAYNEARQAELVEAYHQSILASLRDVEDALVAIRYTAAQETAQLAALDNARASLNLSQSSYAIGMVDYLSVLESERTLHRTEEERVLARLERLNASVALFKALGGGTEPITVGEPNPTAPTATPGGKEG